MPAIHRLERTKSSHLRGRAGAKDITPLHQDIPSTMREELMELDQLELLQKMMTTAPRLFKSIILLQWREPLLIDSKTETNQGKTTTGSTALTRTTLESIDVQMMIERIRLHSKLPAPYGWRNQTRGLFDAPTHYHLSIQHPQKDVMVQYSNCADPSESAARKECIRQAEQQGEFEEAAAQLVRANIESQRSVPPAETRMESTPERVSALERL
ncbi:hypothetical protein F2Q69_00008034 [Brassica cretica]|uniref:Uncharacterized protein n=1 Tax=Brassica cretica TaxID=69181 RepID=A0A8S9P1D8_BRACR|nr:hypothetical protein F2Q69_00008034 [Brassica cretica]